MRDDDAALAAQLVADGHYVSTTQVVGAAMDALRDAIELDRTVDWASVRAAAAEGEAALARGDYVELNGDDELDAYFDRMMERPKTARATRERP